MICKETVNKFVHIGQPHAKESQIAQKKNKYKIE